MKDGWFLFDFALVAIAYVDQFLQQMSMSGNNQQVGRCEFPPQPLLDKFEWPWI